MRFLLLLCFWGNVAVAQQDIVAVVNDTPISSYDVETRVRINLVSSGLPDNVLMREQFRTQTIKALIDETLQQQEIERLKLSPPKGAVEKAFLNLAQKNGTTLEGLTQQLSAKGLPIEPLRQQVATSLTWGAAVQRKYGNDALVSEQDITTLKTQLTQSQGQPEVRFKELYISDFGDQRGQAEAVINSIHKRIIAGASFDALAQQYSESPLRDGSGWVLLNTLEPATIRVLERMKRGSLSPPAKVKGGYALFILQNKRVVRNNSQPQQQVALYQTIIPGNAVDSKERASQFAETITSCTNAATKANEAGLKFSGDLGTLSLSDLPAQLAQAVQQVPVNGSTPPLALEKGFAILTVCDRKNIGSSVAKLPDENALKSRLRSQKLQRLSVEYLDELRRNAFIEYRNS